MSRLGTDDDPVMSKNLSEFDNSTVWDLLDIERSLEYIRNESTLSDSEKEWAVKKYMAVIYYIEEKLGI